MNRTNRAAVYAGCIDDTKMPRCITMLVLMSMGSDGDDKARW